MCTKITSVTCKDIRFPTSLNAHGSDAMHTDPDYSCAYVVIETGSGHHGYGLTFTIGRGTEIVVQAVKSLSYLVLGKTTSEIYGKFGNFWRTLTSESQLRWLGPEKGVVHLAVAAIVNALWDLWARIENKPVWKLLVDLTPEQLLSTIDFRYITDVISQEEALQILYSMRDTTAKREEEMKTHGYPAYTTQAGWLGYSSEIVTKQCLDLMQKGFTAFKIKVGQDLQSDIERCRIVREVIGDDNILMVDANQRWEVQEAIEWTKNLAQFKPLWIEEPTSPDDILGHATIAKALKSVNIGVATGEMCCNRVMFKQFLQANALQFCQIDSCRVGGINEILAILLMARKFNIKVCPHAGGVGLCEMVQHLQIFDYIAITGSKDGRFIEHVAEQHEHFEDPCILNDKACYIAPSAPGYSTKFNEDVLENYEFPSGKVWVKLFSEGVFKID
ncbi:mitochondrial enolase superfamily member 1-like isoform X2 [Neocloeon triangulifer]|uniref:mitochondrial enolase superfamily member 1-like isoform X2 n=1 Tax=Neocloeon triangulifer TaxID=2078957 RepID=UPI00286F26AE|nr:mitochondrial enolase superfamily member 1-like isoform X2 [Neocloeon triangulifer]